MAINESISNVKKYKDKQFENRVKNQFYQNFTDYLTKSIKK